MLDIIPPFLSTPIRPFPPPICNVAIGFDKNTKPQRQSISCKIAWELAIQVVRTGVESYTRLWSCTSKEKA